MGETNTEWWPHLLIVTLAACAKVAVDNVTMKGDTTVEIYDEIKTTRCTTISFQMTTKSLKKNKRLKSLRQRCWEKVDEQKTIGWLSRATLTQQQLPEETRTNNKLWVAIFVGEYGWPSYSKELIGDEATKAFGVIHQEITAMWLKWSSEEKANEALQV